MLMINSIFANLETIENFLWGYFGFPMIILVGLYLTYQSGFLQLRKFPTVVRTFFSFFITKDKCKKEGVPPLKAFFACVGGCVGVGNIVGICTAVQVGGPGALLWVWVTAIIGSMLKYAEVYLGLRYRVMNSKGQYSGGPMYFLRRVFKTPFIPNVVCLLLCIYGVEVYQFSVIVGSLSTNLQINSYLAVFGLLGLVIFAGSGGVRRVGSISSVIIPFFVILYVGMGLWVFLNHLSDIPSVLAGVFQSAFTGHAALGGFIGSTLLMTISQGIRRGCYTGDLGVGYASVIHSESSVRIPEKQASLVIFDIFVDTFLICTTSIMLILLTDIWHQPMEGGMLVQTALAQYFPGMHFFMPCFLFLLGYSTINAYFCVGLKCAEHLSPRYGRGLFYAYAVISLTIFSFFDSTQAQSLMAIVGALLLVINCYGIFRLRNEISYDFDFEKEETLQPVHQEV